jgi:hypothetical protein
MISLLLYTLENEESEDVQAVLCVGLCKLLLSGFVMDPRVSKAFYDLSISPGLTTIFLFVGPDESGITIHRSVDEREHGAETVSVVLLSGVLLLGGGEPG